jgi:SNF family Na+-dependent transporter
MYLMEVALGQFSQLGPLEVWKTMAPIGRGVGFAMCTLSLIVAIYYNVVMAYCLYYMFASFTSVLPWQTCDPNWGADLARYTC